MSSYFPSGSSFNDERHVEFQRANEYGGGLEQQTRAHHLAYDYQEPNESSSYSQATFGYHGEQEEKEEFGYHGEQEEWGEDRRYGPGFQEEPNPAGHSYSYSLATFGYREEQEEDRRYGPGFQGDQREEQLGEGGGSDALFNGPSSSRWVQWQEAVPETARPSPRKGSFAGEYRNDKGKGRDRHPQHTPLSSGWAEAQYDGQQGHTGTPIGANKSQKQSPSIRAPRSKAFVADLRRKVEASKKLPRRKARRYHPSYSAGAVSDNGLPISRMGLTVVALDCEMVGCVEVRVSQTTINPATATEQILHKTQTNPIAHKKKKRVPMVREISVAGRCSVVDYKGNILFDSFIMPHLQIINLRTRWSGIKKRDLENAPRFHNAKGDIRRVLDGCIVVGHAIKNDFNSLEMSFPSDKIRDTSLYLPLRKMAHLNMASPPSLKNLAKVLLSRTIQKRAHCSVEDARATMDVYKKVEIPWESGRY